MIINITKNIEELKRLLPLNNTDQAGVDFDQAQAGHRAYTDAAIYHGVDGDSE